MVRVAVVGLGWWGRIIVGLLEGSRKLAAVKGIDPDSRAAEFARARNLPHTADFGEALRDADVDAVVLCTPHSLHCEQIVAAANARKHVFCEKPLSLSRAEVVRAIDAVKANSVRLAVGHEKRFEPPMMEVARLARSGALGTLLQIEANFSQDKFLALAADNWRLSAKEAPAGPLTATGIHLVDLSVSLMGPVESVCASVQQLGSQLANGDTLAVLARFKGGGHSLISAILATPFDGRVAVYGSKGWAEVRDKAHPEAPQDARHRTARRAEALGRLPDGAGSAREPGGVRGCGRGSRHIPGAARPDDRDRWRARGDREVGAERSGGASRGLSASRAPRGPRRGAPGAGGARGTHHCRKLVIPPGPGLS
jgi:predicted dehydrogenase